MEESRYINLKLFREEIDTFGFWECFYFECQLLSSGRAVNFYQKVRLFSNVFLFQNIIFLAAISTDKQQHNGVVQGILTSVT